MFSFISDGFIVISVLTPLILLALFLKPDHVSIPLAYRQFFLVLLVLYPQSKELPASDIQFGFSGIDEGDDRLRPAASLHLNLNDTFALRTHYYGQDLSPLKERTLLLNGSYLFPFMKLKSLKGGLGLSYLRREITVPEVDYAPGTDLSQSGGLCLSILWNPLPKYPITLAWESNLFLAGSSSILFTTARRQALSISGGYQW